MPHLPLLSFLPFSQAMGRTQMLGAVNMGRGVGFQRRTGRRARQMPGRQMGVRCFG